MYLIDTNVISEFRKVKPHSGVLAWIQSVRDTDLRGLARFGAWHLHLIPSARLFCWLAATRAVRISGGSTNV